MGPDTPWWFWPAAIVTWIVMAYVVVVLFKAITTPTTNPCPAGEFWQADPGSPFGDGECIGG